MYPIRNMELHTKYTFENLINSTRIRAEFFSDYGNLIRELKKQGHNAAAIKHARNKQRIEQELAFLD